MLGTIIIYKLLKKGRIYRSLYWILWLGLLFSFIDIYRYYDFKQNGEDNTIWFSIASDCLGGWVKTALFILETAQISAICDEKLNATHFATMQVIYNLSNALPYLLGTFLVGFISFYIWAFSCVGFGFIFLLCSKKKFNEIDDAPKSEFEWVYEDDNIDIDIVNNREQEILKEKHISNPPSKCNTTKEIPVKETANVQYITDNNQARIDVSITNNSNMDQNNVMTNPSIAITINSIYNSVNLVKNDVLNNNSSTRNKQPHFSNNVSLTPTNPNKN